MNPKADTPATAATSPGSPSQAPGDLSTLPLAEVQKALATSPDGLTGATAQTRLARYGPNELPEKKTNALLQFLSYFWGPIPWMIEAAVVLSAVARHWPDFGIILLLLVANAVVGFWEEHQAGDAIAALKAKLAIKARVKRAGAWISIAARELVPGDVIHLRLGDIVPADARLMDGDPVEVDQSGLTGESLPVTHQAGDAVFSGSTIRTGEIDALVYATGAHTYFGQTAQLVSEAHSVSHFQRAVLRIGNYLILLAILLVTVIIVAALFRSDPLLTTLQFALVLTVAAIPVAMPTVLSVTMAVGARLLAKKEAIVTRLAAIEELAGVDVLCSDKTGTLTQNKLTLGEPFSLEGIPAEQVIRDAALASRADNEDSIDLAVLGGLQDPQALSAFKVVHFQPFDPVHKRTEASIRGPDGLSFRVTKGAPQVILALAADAEQITSAVEQAVDGFAARGFRALGVARAEGDGPWRFLGVLPLFDPPREQAKATIATARALGVGVKMVTGDALAIARETAGQLGLGTNILDASGFGDTKHHETAQLAESIEQADGFAQVFPEHKFHIVAVLQQRGHIVGMTGDGVNDAPALKKADCGIAVSGATDAARAAADIVLMTPGLSVIIDAVKESRKIFQRMNSYAIYRIAETLRVLLFMTLAILIFNFYPLTAVMIVMLALLNDGAILSIAYDNVREADRPEAWNMPVVLGVASVLGVIGPVAAFGLFYLGERVYQLDRAQIQTLMYLMLSVAGHLTIFLTRTRGPFWSIRPAPMLWLAVLGTQTLATLIAVYGLFMTPLGWGWAGFVWAYALLWFLISDRVKLMAYRMFDPATQARVGRRQSADRPTAAPRTADAAGQELREPAHPAQAKAPAPAPFHATQEIGASPGATGAASGLEPASALRIRGLVKRYPGAGVPAVDGIDLDVSPGEIFGLLGPNGAGKTTTIGICTTRVKATSGQVLVGGVDVAADPARVKRFIGVVTQYSTLDRSLTVLENLIYHARYFGSGRREARHRAVSLLDRFQLADSARRMPDQLSGGMAQRLQIARAIGHDPLVLFLDEPTAGLDPQSRLVLWDLVRELRQEGTTILLTTHNMAEAEALCDRIAIIDHGRILVCDTPHSLQLLTAAHTEIDLEVQGPTQDLIATLGALPGIHSAVAVPAGIRILAAGRDGLLQQVIEASHGHALRNVAVRAPTLETVFIELTGRALRD